MTTTDQRRAAVLSKPGPTALFASRMDQRFSYCCYAPSSYSKESDRTYPLAVLVHGSLRNADILRDEFIDFAEENQCVLLAPLFPCGIEEPGDTHNYKLILYRGIRFDLLLLDMIEEISGVYRLQKDRVLMHGFSGGGQFVHRFFYLHPERLLGVSIGAPGTVTLPDENADWWVGTRRMQEIFGRPFNPQAMRQVPVQLVVGEKDTETGTVVVKPTSALWTDGINDTGNTRIERLRALEAAFVGMGIAPRFDMVPGVGHRGGLVQQPVKAFFVDVLNGTTAA
ncbi:alpha/beta hydrolase [Rhizobiaceae bacterium BDR2-2]|uniref:Alpha/beta hydrolase n=1 Tax=Ectorhizobium quercum TaxID=2965071 RepID=A0AAE3SV19_9HYPH|nr:alpha/beta hydrolase [Ectorhizobium quercum]MCX8995890.1 alpha/beta hydrolase [Ectorhizobium quercum]